MGYLRSVRSEALVGADSPRPLRPGSGIDDLKRIRGIGVLIEKKLNSLGVTHYEQVANWTGADIERISNLLDFKGRIERENWIEQARILATGGTDGVLPPQRSLARPRSSIYRRPSGHLRLREPRPAFR